MEKATTSALTMLIFLENSAPHKYTSAAMQIVVELLF